MPIDVDKIKEDLRQAKRCIPTAMPKMYTTIKTKALEGLFGHLTTLLSERERADTPDRPPLDKIENELPNYVAYALRLETESAGLRAEVERLRVYTQKAEKLVDIIHAKLPEGGGVRGEKVSTV